MHKKIKVFDMDINYNIEYRDLKYPRLEFKTGNLVVILPEGTKNETQVLEKHKDGYTTKKFIFNSFKSKRKKLNYIRDDAELKEIIL